MIERDKNYRVLVNKAESAYKEGEYLQAFLIQSCLVEAVVKEYAEEKLKPHFYSSIELSKKYKRFELARLIDDLYIAGKIPKQLYESLSQYRKKRNQVVHSILRYGIDTKALKKELRSVYKSGSGMKGFIIEDMMMSRKGKTLAELASEQEAYLREHFSQVKVAMNKEFAPKLRSAMRSFSKISKK
ncbi:MAG: hypothetical protein NTW60_03775 [Candidatus Wolfebacteria bacterium]|nr:hypothetical protein [Candidatus Wolfebacteria bacterium]